MKKTTTDRKPLTLDLETLRVLHDNELEQAAGGAAEHGVFPTKGCKTFIASFGAPCCNTK